MAEVVKTEYGDVRFGVIRDHSPRKLPWYANSAKIPAAELAEAEVVARHVAGDDERTFEWAMNNYKCWRIGYSHNVRCTMPWFMLTHEKSMERLAALCAHDWTTTGSWHDVNNVLGTGSIGEIRTCGKCGAEDRVTTWYNNYSGD